MDFLCYHLKVMHIEKVVKDSSDCRNKKLQCQEWWKKPFDQPVKNDTRTYGNIMKIAFGQRYDYKTGCLLDYPYFR